MLNVSLPVLITRAEPGARETAVRVEALGLRAVRSPVLVMQTRSDAPLPAIDSLSGLVFTSANGVRAFASRSDQRHLPAWSVGPATAHAARQAGFNTVHESAGNAIDLANYIAKESAPARLLHVANAAAKGDLKRQLEARGFDVSFAPLYEMIGAKALSPDADKMLAQEAAPVVLIHSAMGARRLVELCADRETDSLVIVAISALAAEPLSARPLKAVHIASAPNEDGLMAALATAIATLSA